MPLLVVGISHKTAPIAIRERVMFTPDRLPHARMRPRSRPPGGQLE